MFWLHCAQDIFTLGNEIYKHPSNFCEITVVITDQTACAASARSFALWQQTTTGRDHTPLSHYYCLFLPHTHCIYSIVSRWLRSIFSSLRAPCSQGRLIFSIFLNYRKV